MTEEIKETKDNEKLPKRSDSKNKKNKSKKIRVFKQKRFYQKVWFWILIIFTFGIAGGGYVGWNKYGKMVTEATNTGFQIAESLDKNVLRSDQPTTIYDYQGNEIKRLNTQADYQVKTEDFNKYLRQGFVATEDERFYQHHGVDLWATLRAIATYAKGGSLQGGSTITQQLVKNKILKNSAQTSSRKITEQVVAQELEKKFSKDDILTAYLNYIYFGHGANGVGMAAKYYFNKDQKDLTVRESAVIIGLTNNPTLYDPTINPEESDKKVKEILGKMLRNKVIKQEEYDEAIKQKTELAITPLVNEKDYTDNYAISFAMNRAAEDLAVADGFELKYKFSSDEEYKEYHKVYNQTIQDKMEQIIAGGYKIYTSINPALQSDLENKVYAELSKYGAVNESTGKYDLQTSVTVLDNQTHNVVAIIGGRGTENDYVNRAYQFPRQPGSTAKPIIAYTPAFENGSLLPQSLVRDSQLPEYPTVRNAAGIYYNIDYTVREAVNWSFNTIALKASLMTNIDEVTNKLADMEFHTLHPYDNNNIIAIGGFTYGVTTTEMAGAYSALTNKGVFYQPSNVEKITSAYDDSVLYQNNHQGKKVYTQESSYAMLDVLKTAGSGHTVTDAAALADNYPQEYQGGKTGTTDDYRDVYFASVSHYYTTTVWVGADQPRTLGDYERKEAKIISRIINNTLLAGKTPVDFEKPSTVNKSGNTITFTSQEDISKSKVVNQTNFSAEASKKQEASKAKNKARLEASDYRIVYGLTKEDEEARESKLEDLINKINLNDFTKIADYGKFQKQLAEAQAGLTNIKNSAKKAEFQSKIQSLRSEVTNQYTYLIKLYKESENRELSKEVEAARNAADQNNSGKIAELKNQIISLKEQIETANKNGSDASELLKSLDSTIDQLNKIGEATPYYRIYTDGKSTLFIETDKPTLTKND